MQERIRHKHQTPMFPNGFSVPHAVLVETQMRFPAMIKDYNWPALPIQGEAPLGTPINSISTPTLPCH